MLFTCVAARSVSVTGGLVVRTAEILSEGLEHPVKKVIPETKADQSNAVAAFARLRKR